MRLTHYHNYELKLRREHVLKWMIGFLFFFFSQAYASDYSVDCKKLGIDDIKECVLSATQDPSEKVYGITNMPYALCSKAACKLAKDKKTAMCQCELEHYKRGWKSFSASPTPYVSAQPTYNEDGSVQTVQSNYSMANISNFTKGITQTCTYNTPRLWANCYGVRCGVKTKKINGQQTHVVNCMCPVQSDKKFLIGSVGKAACEQTDIIWSATTGSSFLIYGQNPMSILYKRIFPKSPPASKKN